MRILLTGGETGGHFYPIIAISEAIRDLASEQKVLDPELYFMAPRPFDKKALFDHQIIYKKVPAGKIRRYFSPLNFFDWFKMGYGIIKAIIQVFFIYDNIITKL